MTQIAEELSAQALVEQLIEECGELTQALAKFLRITRGENYTPVTEEHNMKQLTEELADVEICTIIVKEKLNIETEKIKKKKFSRWSKRINENKNL